MTQFDDALTELKAAVTEITKAGPFSVSAQRVTRAVAAIAPAVDVDRRAAVYDACNAPPTPPPTPSRHTHPEHSMTPAEKAADPDSDGTLTCGICGTSYEPVDLDECYCCPYCGEWEHSND